MEKEVYLKKLREHFANDKYASESTDCVIEDADENYAKCSFIISEKHQNAVHGVMGGAIFTLFDNTNFSFFMFVYSLVIFVLSGILLFFVPGLSGILINYNNALRLRLYKYDWLEEHPEITGKQAQKMIPWKKLIAEDEEALGPRNIRNFLFPWK